MRSNDTGLGIVEVLVAMTILVVALATFGMALSSALKVSRRSQDMGEVTDQVRMALETLDRQVRFGYLIRQVNNIGGLATSNVVVLTPDATGKLQCWAWATSSEGFLATYHAPYVQGQNFQPPPLQTLKSLKDWKVVAGADLSSPPGQPSQVLVTGGFSVGHMVESLRALAVVGGSGYERVASWAETTANLTVSKAGLAGAPGQSVDFDVVMTLRNQWLAATYAKDNACA